MDPNKSLICTKNHYHTFQGYRYHKAARMAKVVASSTAYTIHLLHPFCWMLYIMHLYVFFSCRRWHKTMLLARDDAWIQQLETRLEILYIITTYTTGDRLFAECQVICRVLFFGHSAKTPLPSVFFDTRQRGSLPSVFFNTRQRISLPSVFFTLGKELLCRVLFFWHSAKKISKHILKQ